MNQIMKNRNLILSILFWAVNATIFAVTLPSSSYSGSFVGGADSYEVQLGTGTSMVGSTLLSSSGIDTDTSVCTEEGVQGSPSDCGICCYNNVYSDCISKGGTTKECGALNTTCVQSCTQGTSLPLGTPLLLLPFIAVYALVRRNRKDKE